jgi:hypothetical protein
VSEPDLPEAIRRGIDIVRRGDPWSIVRMRLTSEQAGPLEPRALLERSVASIRAVPERGELNEAGRCALEAIEAAITAVDQLAEATVYPWKVVAPVGDGPPKLPAPRPPQKPASIAELPDIVRRAVDVVWKIGPFKVERIMRERLSQRSRTKAASEAIIRLAPARRGPGDSGATTGVDRARPGRSASRRRLRG